ncbi:hypothetical protein [Acetobacter musti]|nr:hypothetical protein [Acetobacter musti]
MAGLTFPGGAWPGAGSCPVAQAAWRGWGLRLLRVEPDRVAVGERLTGA